MKRPTPIKPTNIEELDKLCDELNLGDWSMEWDEKAGKPVEFNPRDKLRKAFAAHTKSLLKRLEEQALDYEIDTSNDGTKHLYAKAVPLRVIQEELSHYD